MGKRKDSWRHNEEVILCQAWITITTDGATGTNQSADTMIEGLPTILVSPNPKWGKTCSSQRNLRAKLRDGFVFHIILFNLHQIAAQSKMAEAAQNPVSQPEKIVIANKHGEKLVGLLHETGSKELVILCHGARSHKGDNIMTKLALALEKEGISAFRFDFAGNGRG
ncbi:hypothetical protein ACLB2K_005369 [Fragaria x ananassa]